MREMRAERMYVRDISWLLIPNEEVVFSVCEAPSAAAVRLLNERAGIPVSRVVEVTMVTGDQSWLSTLPDNRVRFRGAEPGG